MEKQQSEGLHRPRKLMFRWTLWFMLANGMVLALVAIKYLKMMPLPDQAVALAFLWVSYPVHFFSLALYVFPLAAVVILIYPRPPLVFGLSILLELCLVLGVIIDSLVFAQYRFHLNGMIWNLLTSGAAGEVLPVTGKLWVVLAVAILLLGGLEWLIAVCCWHWVNRQRKPMGTAVFCALLIAALSAHFMHAWADANNVTSITSQVRYLPAFRPLTMKRLLARVGLAGEASAATLKIGKGKEALRYPLEKLAFREVPGKPLNLVVIAVESWRFDHLTPEVTPNIWKFSEDNLRFDNHFSSGNCTRFGIFGIFYGLYGTYWHPVLAEERSPVLMQELEKRHYRMGIFGSAPLVSPEFDRTVFADLRKQIPLNTPGGTPSQRDRAITDRMLDFISKTKAGDPFFGFLFYDAPHCEDHPKTVRPFRPELSEVNYLTLNNDTDPVPFLNTYRNSLYYVDGLVAEVIAALEKKDLLDNTVVVITGDHAQEFNDLKLNYWGHCGNFSKYQTQIPLIVHWPGKKHQVYGHLTSHLDLAPTLMKEMLGCQTDPSRYANGRYLDDASPRPFVLISSWDTFSINERDRITVSQPSGQVEVLSPSYRPLAGARVNPEVSKNAMEGMGRFFAR
jgi:uncharacterized protein